MDFVIEHIELLAGLWYGLGLLGWWLLVRYIFKEIDIIDIALAPLVAAGGPFIFLVSILTLTVDVTPFKTWED